MAKFLSICYRNPAHTPHNINQLLTNLSTILVPDNFTPNPPKILSGKGVITAIINPTEIIKTQGLSVCVGIMTNNSRDWDRPGNKAPDGNYALIRTRKNIIELVTDYAGTHSIWYYFNDEVFITSSSQRAIIAALGDFEPNIDAYPWMLAGGALGPNMAWDKRLKSVQNSHSRLILDRFAWRIEEKVNSIEFAPVKRANKEYFPWYMDSMKSALADFPLKNEHWALTLSGGYDSRVLLLLLNKSEKLRTLTWGYTASQNNQLSDTVIAEKLAKSQEVENQFFPTNQKSVSFETSFQRFIVAGEGRVDKIAAYLDGFNMWKEFFEAGIYGVIRGDRGTSEGATPKNIDDIYLNGNCPSLSNFFPEDLIETWDLPKQELPEFYQKREKESLSTYRDRFYHIYRSPGYRAGLNDLKLPFTEVFQPFLTKKVGEIYLQLPDEYRANKTFLKKLAKKISPPIRFAEMDSNVDYKDLFREPEITNFLFSKLSDKANEGLLPDNLINYLLTGINSQISKTIGQRHSNAKILKKRMKSILPKAFTPKKGTKSLSINKMAFRAGIILEVNQLFNEAANFAKKMESELTRINQNMG